MEQRARRGLHPRRPHGNVCVSRRARFVVQYRAARPLEEAGFVATGPPRTEAVMKQCARVGMYTDDTNSALALAASIVENKGVDSGHAAHNYAKFWREGDAVRFQAFPTYTFCYILCRYEATL
jgi:hypothetical protein